MNYLARYCIPTKPGIFPHDADLRHAAKVLVLFLFSLLAVCGLVWWALS